MDRRYAMLIWTLACTAFDGSSSYADAARDRPLCRRVEHPQGPAQAVQFITRSCTGKVKSVLEFPS